jgi:hypothetical protein
MIESLTDMVAVTVIALMLMLIMFALLHVASVIERDTKMKEREIVLNKMSLHMLISRDHGKLKDIPAYMEPFCIAVNAV